MGSFSPKVKIRVRIKVVPVSSQPSGRVNRSWWLSSPVGWKYTFLDGSRLHTSDSTQSGAIPMHSGAPRGTEMGPRLFLVFVNDLSDALEALTLLFPDDVEVVTRRTQSMNLHVYPYCYMGPVEEMGPTGQYYKIQLFHIWAEGSPEIALFPLDPALPSVYPN